MCIFVIISDPFFQVFSVYVIFIIIIIIIFIVVCYCCIPPPNLLSVALFFFGSSEYLSICAQEFSKLAKLKESNGMETMTENLKIVNTKRSRHGDYKMQKLIFQRNQNRRTNQKWRETETKNEEKNKERPI